jgi:hypothetical protein
MKKYIIILFAVFAISSCVDLYQEPQSDLTPETIVLTRPTLEAMVNGLYKSFWGNNFGFNCRTASLALSADDMITGMVSKPRNTQDDQMRVSVDNADVSSLWKSFYKTIFDANNLILSITSNPDLDPELGKIYLGEAYFFRALSYFYVVRYFGDAPAITDPTGSSDIDGNISMPRKSVKTIYDRIIVPDLLEAEKLLKVQSRDNKNQAPTIWAAKTLLTDVYLTMAGWPLKEEKYYTEAATKAKEVIDGGAHSLMTNYKDLWLEANKTDKTEHIFALQHSLTYLPSQYGISFLGVEEGNGWSDYAADPVFFANFPDDTRKAFCYVTSTTNSSNGQVINWTEFASGGPYIRKYRNYGGCGNYGIEGETSNRNQLSQGLTPIYRYADVLLFYAEASNKAEGGPNALAYECINKVRDRAFGNTNHRLSGLNQSQFAKAVFDEFGWENVFEFKRWFQLVRTEMVDEAVGKNAAVDARLNVNKENYLFPIPVRQAELRGWTNNPGY